jgi:uncharacterized protein
MKLLKCRIINHVHLVLLILIFGCSKEKSKYHEYPIAAIDIKNVVLTDSFWLPKIKVIQNTTIQYAFDKCDQEGRMENFLIAGGKKKGKVRGKMPFDDSDLYKIIEGASYSLISNPNPKLDKYIDSIIDIIKTGQEQDGYLTTWITIDPTNSPAEWAKPAGKRWEGEITSHELYNTGHLYEAAAAHFQATGKRNFLDIALKNADLMVNTFGPGKLTMPPGHQIIETGLIKLYRITHNEEYLKLAKFFLDQRGDSTSHKLFGPYSQDHLPVIKQEEVVGHAVRAVYMYAGMTDIAAHYHDQDYMDAVLKLWKNMIDKKLYITGGIGSRHEGEAFGDNYELPNLTAYNETCAGIGSVYWNHRLFLLTGESKYYDILERTLYNGLISGISLDGTKFFYPNPLESDAEYKFNMGYCTRASWFDCSCCPTNLIRFLPSVPGLIYATNKDSLFVNLYISNQANMSINESNIQVIQQAGFPWNGLVAMTVNPERKTAFTLKLRVPGWAQNKPVPGSLYQYIGNSPEKILLKINGKNEKPVIKNGYIEISKEWNKGDKVELTLPMEIRRVIANDKVGEDRNRVALEYGPIVYCAEEADNIKQIPAIIIPDQAELNIEKRNILSDQILLITGNSFEAKPELNKAEKEKLILIPYYLWSNRGVGKMKVWFPRKAE